MADQTKRVRVALVEDHAATRTELAALLEEQPERVRLVGAFANGESILRAPEVAEVDVALVDLRLPGVDGFEVIRALVAQHPAIRALALTVFADEKSVLGALRAGAFGYLVKGEPVERLMLAIEEAAAGEHPVSSRIAGYLIHRSRLAPPPVVLSDREDELAKALAEGLTYVECAERMQISVGTVQSYVKRVYRKLDVNSRSEVREWVERYAHDR